MDEAPNPPPVEPVAPVPPPGPTAPAPRPKWPWIVGGCGCLVLLGIIIVAVVMILAAIGAKSTTQQFDPYRGQLAALLPKELSTGNIKFELSGTTNRQADWQKEGATEALGF